MVSNKIINQIYVYTFFFFDYFNIILNTTDGTLNQLIAIQKSSSVQRSKVYIIKKFKQLSKTRN